MTIHELTLEISKLPIAERLTLLEMIAKSLKEELQTSPDEFNELLKKRKVPGRDRTAWNIRNRAGLIGKTGEGFQPWAGYN